MQIPRKVHGDHAGEGARDARRKQPAGEKWPTRGKAKRRTSMSAGRRRGSDRAPGQKREDPHDRTR
eukprot:6173652-Pleurochrysis_carterae.AAC.20